MQELSYVCHEATSILCLSRRQTDPERVVAVLKIVIWLVFLTLNFSSCGLRSCSAVIFAKSTTLLPLLEGLKTRHENAVEKASNLSAM